MHKSCVTRIIVEDSKVDSIEIIISYRYIEVWLGPGPKL